MLSAALGRREVARSPSPAGSGLDVDHQGDELAPHGA
jgi:hypothetical protein